MGITPEKRRLKVLALVAGLGLVAGACGGGGGGASPSASAAVNKINVTVYGQGAWTGSFSSLVLPSMQSAEIHFNELNADPSFPATITFKQADTQGSSTKAPPVVQDVVSDPNTVAVFGPAFSGESLVSGDTYNENKIPFVTASATSVTLAGKRWDYWYRAVGNDDAQGRLVADFVTKYVKPQRLFVLHDKSTYGQPPTSSRSTPSKKARTRSRSRCTRRRDTTSPASSARGSSTPSATATRHRPPFGWASSSTSTA